MDASYITPYIDSTKSVFQTMLSLEITIGKPLIRETIPTAAFDVSGIIGMSGDVIGTVMLSFPMGSALEIVKRFTGTEFHAESEDFGDAIGELVNMVSGAAKAQFEGKQVSISCPSVVVGLGHKIQQPSDSICISIPCDSESGSFAVEICFKKSSIENKMKQASTGAVS
jgi:chemotaxis protein CheX